MFQPNKNFISHLHIPVYNERASGASVCVPWKIRLLSFTQKRLQETNENYLEFGPKRIRGPHCNLG